MLDEYTGSGDRFPFAELGKRFLASSTVGSIAVSIVKDEVSMADRSYWENVIDEQPVVGC